MKLKELLTILKEDEYCEIRIEVKDGYFSGESWIESACVGFLKKWLTENQVSREVIEVKLTNEPIFAITKIAREKERLWTILLAKPEDK